MNHLELIVKNGTVKIPSIFMFEHSDELLIFLSRAREANCSVIFDNEDLTVTPDNDDFGIRAKIHVYSSIIACREIGNSYARFIMNIGEMTWDNVQSTKED